MICRPPQRQASFSCVPNRASNFGAHTLDGCDRGTNSASCLVFMSFGRSKQLAVAKQRATVLRTRAPGSWLFPPQISGTEDTLSLVFFFRLLLRRPYRLPTTICTSCWRPNRRAWASVRPVQCKGSSGRHQCPVSEPRKPGKTSNNIPPLPSATLSDAVATDHIPLRLSAKGRQALLLSFPVADKFSISIYRR